MLLPSRLTLALAAALVIAVAGAGVLLHWQGRRLDAAKNELAVARANVTALEAAISQQNAAIERAATAGRRRQEAAAAAVAQAPTVRRHVVEPLSSPASGQTLSERVEDIDRRFLESLR